MSDRETDHCLTKWRPRDWSLPDKVNYFHWSTTESIQKHDQVDNEGSQPEQCCPFMLTLKIYQTTLCKHWRFHRASSVLMGLTETLAKAASPKVTWTGSASGSTRAWQARAFLASSLRLSSSSGLQLAMGKNKMKQYFCTYDEKIHFSNVAIYMHI